MKDWLSNNLIESTHQSTIKNQLEKSFSKGFDVNKKQINWRAATSSQVWKNTVKGTNNFQGKQHLELAV